MGRFCILCAHIRPNEDFGGKGERARICRSCRSIPRAQREALKHEREILGFLEQSRISDKNIARLRTPVQSDNGRIADLAACVLAVAQAAPYRRRRIRILARQHRDVLKRMEAVGLLLPTTPQEDSDPDDPAAAWEEWAEYANTRGDG